MKGILFTVIFLSLSSYVLGQQSNIISELSQLTSGLPSNQIEIGDNRSIDVIIGSNDAGSGAIIGIEVNNEIDLEIFELNGMNLGAEVVPAVSNVNGIDFETFTLDGPGSYRIFISPFSIGTTEISAFENDTGDFGSFPIEVVSAVVLPVIWNSFEGIRNKDIVELTWDVESQQDNDYYSVENSVNGIDWTTIEFIRNNLELEYKFNDNNIYSGYYRIMQVDLDGSSSYSNTIFVNAAEQRTIQYNIYPTFTHTGIIYIDISDNLEMSNLKYEYQVYNIDTGAKLKSGEFVARENQILIDDVKGSFLIRIRSNEGKGEGSAT